MRNTEVHLLEDTVTSVCKNQGADRLGLIDTGLRVVENKAVAGWNQRFL